MVKKVGILNFNPEIFQKHKEQQVNPMAAQKARAGNWDPKKSTVLQAIHAQ